MHCNHQAILVLSVLLLGPAHAVPISGVAGMLPEARSENTPKGGAFSVDDAAQIWKRNHNIADIAQQDDTYSMYETGHISKRNHNIGNMAQLGDTSSMLLAAYISKRNHNIGSMGDMSKSDTMDDNVPVITNPKWTVPGPVDDENNVATVEDSNGGHDGVTAKTAVMNPDPDRDLPVGHLKSASSSFRSS